MYIDNENFEKWMEKLSKKLTVIGQDLKSLINTDTVLDDNEKILDNQDLAFLLKVSFRTLPESPILEGFDKFYPQALVSLDK